jgi:hypothetical protein
MDIGKEEGAIIVEPLEDPFETPAPTTPAPTPVEPEKVPA